MSAVMGTFDSSPVGNGEDFTAQAAADSGDEPALSPRAVLDGEPDGSMDPDEVMEETVAPTEAEPWKASEEDRSDEGEPSTETFSCSADAGSDCPGEIGPTLAFELSLKENSPNEKIFMLLRCAIRNEKISFI